MDELLLADAVAHHCEGCRATTAFLPVGPDGCYCCTGCDEAVFLLTVVGHGPQEHRPASRVA